MCVYAGEENGVSIDLTRGDYLHVWEWIQNRRMGNIPWDRISTGFNAADINEFILRKIEEDGWPEDITNDIFQEIVKEQRRIEENQNSGFICGPQGRLNDFHPSMNQRSAWQCYKKTLRENKKFDFETVQTIELSTARILSHLSNDTSERERDEVVKGLVIGNVQSGKTANMEALMTMAADYGWNMFIILSGTIENLRRQTQQRFLRDLHENDGDINWMEIPRPCIGGEGPKPQDMYFDRRNNLRYFTVCLKNAVRLRNLINWLQSDRNQIENMRILVIDDECDQAGINTANIDANEKTEIYRCITNLVNQRCVDENETVPKYGAMNYVGYTATPYANMLNDPRCESLYPRDFISTLTVSKQYFGPQQIFGNDDLGYKGLSIVNEISRNDLEEVVEIHRGESSDLPDSLKEAILWFICCTGVMRFNGSTKPLSMLVHTSQRTDHHEHVATAIQNWLHNSSVDVLIDACKRVWEEQTSKFNYEKLQRQYPDYKADDRTMKEYPSFEEIKPVIKDMLEVEDNRYTHIELNADNQNEREFSRAVHICVDNCRNNRPVANADDGAYYHLRLAYPTEGDHLDFAAAFLVIGGATLSRGLTIEGLVSSYFLRSIPTADSLMQMGRWFGYRKGYELLPRLWLTNDTVKQFKYLSSMDYELRETIREMEDAGKTPYDYRIRILLPEREGLLHLTAENRMHAVIPAYDYSGTYKQTYKFDNNEDIMRANIEIFETFLDVLGTPCPSGANRYSQSSQVWRGVGIETVLNFLNSYNFSLSLEECRNVVRWLNTMEVSNVLHTWNVVLAGNMTPSELLGTYTHNGYSVNKVNRSRFSTEVEEDETIINIGSLRSPRDLLADIDLSVNPELEDKVNHSDSKDVKKIRGDSSCKVTPQLLMYVVSAASQPEGDEERRQPLNTRYDLIGLSINIPEQNRLTVDRDLRRYAEIDYSRFGIQYSVDIAEAD